MKFFRWHLKFSETVLVLLFVGCVGYTGTLGYGAFRQFLQGSPEFSGERAMVYTEEQMSFGPRITGSLASRKFRVWLSEHLRLTGWQVFFHQFTIGTDNPLQGTNVIAFKGSGPEILIGAHYDSRLWADADPDPKLRERPVPGANDGASGVAVLMELARVLDVAATQHTVCLAFFDAEDNGRIPGWNWILGSSAYVQDLEQHANCGNPQNVVIVDMVGDLNQELYIEQTGNQQLAGAIWQQAHDLEYGAWFRPEPGYHLIDDHTPFLNVGIPAITVIDFDYPYWHTVADTLDKVSAESLARVGHVMEVWLENGAQTADREQ